MSSPQTTTRSRVNERRPPVELPAVPSPIDAKAVYDMTGQNEWASNAVQWLETYDAAKANDGASKLLKSMVPPDAHKCFGHGVRITRDRAGRLSLREG